mmetsp:Transcript_27838/g.66135  ORF Transcript_27838/g.66135 Transcript_27838/m.66135 type:complete len:311 (-) Transcript_27838:897-1829(-)
MNKHSSRSHTVFTIHIESRPDPESEEATFSKLHLVDLAGSERIQKTGSTGQVLREAVHINKSLAFLEQVVVALSERNRDHVPYRSSKLTHLLKDSLGGNCKTLMIANVWADPEHVDETISTCRFAQRMSCVANEAVVNVKQDSEKLVRELKREVEDLKAELAMHDQFASRSGVSYAPYSDSQRLLVRRLLSAPCCRKEKGAGMILRWGFGQSRRCRDATSAGEGAWSVLLRLPTSARLSPVTSAGRELLPLGRARQLRGASGAPEPPPRQGDPLAVQSPLQRQVGSGRRTEQSPEIGLRRLARRLRAAAS